MHLAAGVLAPAAQHRHETALQRAAIAGISLERPTRSGPHLESGNRSCLECLESWNRSCVECLESGNRSCLECLESWNRSCVECLESGSGGIGRV